MRSARQPSRNRPKKHSATTTKAMAVPWPAMIRSTMPTATVMTTMIAPERSVRGSARRASTTNQPATRPTTKGQQVDSIPVAEIP